ncbi:LA-RELATED PROTEIN 6C [Salix viminalis]|uniref:LA-RELATED PROTEIN 6C n=1 Tax=Salix viminalis TaxID=40686 RepID=A0A9Q0QJF0_SALVM|nr:LA-RELATED PROTEIN 6C [Salix viminalis]
MSKHIRKDPEGYVPIASSSELVLTEDGNKGKRKIPFTDKHREELQVEKLNDERNWRKGLRVRLLLRCSPKSVLTRGRKSEFDNILEEEDSSLDESLEHTSRPNNSESAIDSFVEDNPGASKKARARGHGKGKCRGQIICARGMLAPPKCESSAKQISKGPRMPDGTEGFTVGRGKPPLVTQV